jgi:hypothetical protein
MLAPLDGVLGAPAAGHPLYHLRTLSYSRPMVIVGPVLDTVAISRAIVGTSCKELGRHVNMGLLCPFTVSGKGPPLCLLGCNTVEQ